MGLYSRRGFVFYDIHKIIGKFGYNYDKLPILTCNDEWDIFKPLEHAVTKLILYENGKKKDGIAFKLNNTSTGEKGTLFLCNTNITNNIAIISCSFSWFIKCSICATRSSLCPFYDDRCVFVQKLKSSLTTYTFLVELIDESTQLYILDLSEIVVSYMGFEFSSIQIF